MMMIVPSNPYPALLFRNLSAMSDNGRGAYMDSGSFKHNFGT
jgi:hypothetical protein